MTSLQKTEANRRNARASTGPRSAAGKARAARNARRHGLAVSIWSDASLTTDAEALAIELAGRDASPAILALSRRIAEAQIDLRRIRATRQHLIAAKVTNSDPAAGHDLKNLAPLTKLARGLSDIGPQLELLDRYERRALSRRKFAIREFDLGRCKAALIAAPS